MVRSKGARGLMVVLVGVVVVVHAHTPIVGLGLRAVVQPLANLPMWRAGSVVGNVTGRRVRALTVCSGKTARRAPRGAVAWPLGCGWRPGRREHILLSGLGARCYSRGGPAGP